MLIGKKKPISPEKQEEIRTKDFFDCILPSAVRFYNDHYIMGNTYRCVWVIREYPPSTEEQAILSRLADISGVTIRIYNRLVDSTERGKIIQNAMRKNRLQSGSDNVQESIEAAGNLQDVADLLGSSRTNREPLLHCCVFIELQAPSIEDLKNLQMDVSMELTRSKITVDKLLLRQKSGFLSVTPFGTNQFGATFERVLPLSSVANLYPLSYSGKTDPNGIFIGRDKYGTNILVDFDQRSDDKTNSNILILGSPGQGKSHLLKLILTNMREAGKNIICLDPEEEYRDLCVALGGSYIDFMGGGAIINPLEPKSWAGEDADADESAPDAFRHTTRLSQHIAYLKDFFRSYKDFSDPQIDTIEIMLEKLYANFGISENTDWPLLRHTDFPTMEDFYRLCDTELKGFDSAGRSLYKKDTLREICLGIRSMCIGTESAYFNGYTNIADGAFLVFGVKGVMETNQKLRDALLFNILSYMNNQLLSQGNTVASIDEFYMFLTNLTAVEYIRNASKRVRKKDSAVILASQNINDFLLPAVQEYTKPLFAIPTHQFLFHPGNCNAREFLDTIQLEQTEFNLIKNPERGTCLYRCGNERYLLQVIAPDYKSRLFGKAGGR